MLDVLTIVFVCPVTMKAVEVTVKDNVEITGYCENSEYSWQHFIEVNCSECKKQHKLS